LGRTIIKNRAEIRSHENSRGREMAVEIIEAGLAAARTMGVDLPAELKNHNSTPVLMKLKSGIYTGNTGIVGGDLRGVLIPNPK